MKIAINIKPFTHIDFCFPAITLENSIGSLSFRERKGKNQNKKKKRKNTASSAKKCIIYENFNVTVFDFTMHTCTIYSMCSYRNKFEL